MIELIGGDCMIKTTNGNIKIKTERGSGIISKSAALYLAEIIVQEFQKNKELQKAFEEWKKTPEAARYA